MLLPMLAALAAASTVPAEAPVETPGPLAPLKGAMVMPRKGAPVVLIVPGSGPTDRDGNNPLGIAAAPYRLLADALAARGIGTVRIDKRGLGGSAAAVIDGNRVTIEDYATDVRGWIATLRQSTGRSCLWVLGHSEGGLIALAAAQGRTDICGVILVAAAGRPLGQILREQLAANPVNAPILPQGLAAIDALERGRKVDVSALHPALQQLFAPSVQDFLIDMFAHDPAKLIATVKQPVLIVQGRRDVQVGVVDAEALKKANPAATLVLLRDVNHVLKLVQSDDRAANVATYRDPALPLAPGVADAIADFITAHPAE